jgi:ribosome biogenesis protein UTP30
MTAKAASAKAAKAAKTLKSPKTTKADKTAKKQVKNENDNRHKTGLDAKLVERAVKALLAYHEKQSEDKLSLLGNDKPIQVQLTLLRSPSNGNPKPIRILIPHPLFQLADKDDDSNGDSAMEEPEICLIVKEESKLWCQEMIDRFPDHMGCVKKVLGLQSLRKKHASYEQRRELLSKYNFFMADDRILPMLSKALGKEFFKAKKLPIPISLTRKEALPFAIQKALSATYMSVSSGTCITIR